jgi:DNA-directed RNA polymerase specialized sigma24 family protein
LSDSTPASSAPAEGAALAELVAVERAIAKLPAAHRKTLVLLYVHRLAAHTVSRALRLRFEGWSAWIASCRSMVANLLRRGMNGAAHAHVLHAMDETTVRK